MKFISSLSNPRIPGFVWQEPEDEGDRKMFRDILEHGCQVIAIEPSEHNPDYSFSVGLYLNFLHPEILIMGVSQQACHRAINLICSEAESGSQLRAGDTRTELFEMNRPVRFIPVPEPFYTEYLGCAVWFHRSLFLIEPVVTHKFPVLQALWPDSNGFYPDDPRCDPVVRDAQLLVVQVDGEV